MMKCEKCGTNLMDDDKFCPICGTKVERTVIDRNIKDTNPYQGYQPINKQSIVENNNINEEIQSNSAEENVIESNVNIVNNDDIVEKSNHVNSVKTPFDIKHNLITLVGCIVAAVGTILPFAASNVSIMGYSYNQSVNYISRDGIFLVLLLIATVGLVGYRKEKLSLIPAALAIALLTYDVVSIPSATSSSGIVNSLFSSSTSMSTGFGVYVMYIGLVVAVIGILINFKES